MRQRNSKKNNKLNGINTWYTLINIKSTNLHPVLFHVDCRSAMFMFGYIILFDIAGVIIIPLQSWSQHSVGQAVTVCRQNPQGDPWKELHFHFRGLLDQRLYFAAQSVFSDCKLEDSYHTNFGFLCAWITLRYLFFVCGQILCGHSS